PEENGLLPTDGREPCQPLAVGGRPGTFIAHLTFFPLQEYRRISWKNQSPSDGMSLPITSHVFAPVVTTSSRRPRSITTMVPRPMITTMPTGLNGKSKR